jgi:hypothetical protein
VIIASRIPDGTRGTCSVCGAMVIIDPSVGTGDAPCPVCEVLLWFMATIEGVKFHTWDSAPADLGERMRVFLSRHDDFFLHIDSLDKVELVLEIEEEFGVVIPAEEMKQMRGIGDIIDYLFCRWRTGE